MLINPSTTTHAGLPVSSESVSSAGNRADAEHPPRTPACVDTASTPPVPRAFTTGSAARGAARGCPETPPGRYCTFRPQRWSGIHPQAGWLCDGAPAHTCSRGICQTMRDDASSSGRCGLAFLLTRQWPWPPQATSTELALGLRARRPRLGDVQGKRRRSWARLSSGRGSREPEPWDGVGDPDEEETSLPWVMVPGEAPSQTASGPPRPAQSPGASPGGASRCSSSWGSALGGGLSLGLSLSALKAAAATTRNLTGPWCAW